MNTSPVVNRVRIFLLSVLLLAVTAHQPARCAAVETNGIPVILDADIGDDIDDTWALGLLLKSPELNLRLVVGDYGRVEYRAKLFAKFLSSCGRSDVPVGLGIPSGPTGEGRQAAWVGDYQLSQYPGPVLTNGVQALIDTVMKSEKPVTLICIGPAPNIAAALKREPRLAAKVQFVGMYGSVRRGYDGAVKPMPEYNVRCDVPACQAMFAAPWPITITPLDTCGLVRLKGAKYQQLLQSREPVAVKIIENYRAWAAANEKVGASEAEVQSSILFDTVAVYLAFQQGLCVMENIGIRVDREGNTIEDPAARKTNVAVDWKDLNTFEDLLVKRLTNK